MINGFKTFFFPSFCQFFQRDNRREKQKKTDCLSTLQDLPDSISAEELANYFDLKELNEHPHLFQSISAFDG
jgi:hypothetical protein